MYTHVFKPIKSTNNVILPSHFHVLSALISAMDIVSFQDKLFCLRQDTEAGTVELESTIYNVHNNGFEVTETDISGKFGLEKACFVLLSLTFLLFLVPLS